LFTFVTGSASECERACDALIRSLTRLVDGRSRRALVIREMDGRAPQESRWSSAFIRAGFVSTQDGYFYKPKEVESAKY